MCPQCLSLCPGSFVAREGKVFLERTCKEHGLHSELIEDNLEYFELQKHFCKPGTPSKTQTIRDKGCPYDCGLCNEHKQHTCIGLIEVTNKCNLRCPACYASSGEGEFLSLKKIEAMMDFFQEVEYGKAELLQLSGGEPTLHPDILKIITLAQEKKFKYTMLNTNGLRIAEDETFVAELAKIPERFEVYLQWDGVTEKPFEALRGAKLLQTKKKALALLEKYKIPTTLVVTVADGVNDQELGPLFLLALNSPTIRGINFQPLARFGRLPSESTSVTKTGIMQRLADQTNGMLRMDDFVPLPCFPERIAFSYLARKGGAFYPVTRGKNAEKFVPWIKNSFTFMPEDVIDTVKTAPPQNWVEMCDCFSFLGTLKALAPLPYFSWKSTKKREHIAMNTFRISISSFIDAYTYDQEAMQKECVHIITPDLKRIPFSAYSLLYRGQEK